MAKPIKIDGSTGEGGGQIIRLAITLSALTTRPVTITNIRGNRPSSGLKDQHVTIIKYLAEATQAEVTPIYPGTKSLTFTPRLAPSALINRTIKIVASSAAASSLLILQAVLPFLIFASTPAGNTDPITLEITGGTNVAFSPSYEYLDQVLLPTLEARFGIVVGRELESRSWSMGKQVASGQNGAKFQGGVIRLKIWPLKHGEKLKFIPCSGSRSLDIDSIDVSILAPVAYHQQLQRALTAELELFPRLQKVNFKIVQDSEQDSRWHILLVGHSKSGLIRGQDILTSLPKKAKSADALISKINKTICSQLRWEDSLQSQVDVHLQDQLIIFQSLCEGLSSLPRHDDNTRQNYLLDDLGHLDVGQKMKKDRMDGEPFGHGSLHTKTARWVVCELLPGATFYNGGDIVQGAGFSSA